jgi:3,4-dihydroxy-2-butanone 4-phosphate synthase/GTP cyclohydrolase II
MPIEVPTVRNRRDRLHFPIDAIEAPGPGASSPSGVAGVAWPGVAERRAPSVSEQIIAVRKALARGEVVLVCGPTAPTLVAAAEALDTDALVMIGRLGNGGLPFLCVPEKRFLELRPDSGRSERPAGGWRADWIDARSVGCAVDGLMDSARDRLAVIRMVIGGGEGLIGPTTGAGRVPVLIEPVSRSAAGGPTAGHAILDLIESLGMSRAAICCSPLNDDGAALTSAQAVALARRRGLLTCTAGEVEADLATFFLSSPVRLPTPIGVFDARALAGFAGDRAEHLILSRGDLCGSDEVVSLGVYVRPGTADALRGGVFREGSALLELATSIARSAAGVLIYLSREGVDWMRESPRHRGPAVPSMRERTIVGAALLRLGVREVRLIAEDPKLSETLAKLGIGGG